MQRRLTASAQTENKVRIHDERLVYKLRLRKARNERRKAYRLEQAAVEKKAALEKQQQRQQLAA